MCIAASVHIYFTIFNKFSIFYNNFKRTYIGIHLRILKDVLIEDV